MTFWFLPNLLRRPAACMRLSLVIDGESVKTAEMLASIFMSAPLVRYSSKITKVSLSEMLVPLSTQSWLDSLYTFQLLSTQNEIPLNSSLWLNFLWLEIQGTTSSFSDLLANTAPASIMLDTLYYFGRSNTERTNLSQRGSVPSLMSSTLKTFWRRSSSIFPSVPAISLLEDITNLTYIGKSLQLSLVPEKPTQVFTFEWSHEDEVIDCLNYPVSLVKTQYFTQ